MGLFLALSGVIDANADEVKAALSEFAELQSGGFEEAEGTTDTPNISVLTSNGRNATVFYPNGFFEWDDASKYISQKLARPVFSLHIHDGDLWMFVLFRDGNEIGQFNPIPDYWEKLSPEERVKWKGDPFLIADVVPGVSIESIAKYFVEWDLEAEDPPRAYPDDEFSFGDCWQLCDFMKKSGLEYPVGDDGSIKGETFKLWTKGLPLHQAAQAKNSKKPWWKLW